MKLSGGAIPIPQKIHDECVEFIREAVAHSIGLMFSDIPEKLAVIESILELKRKEFNLSIKDLIRFGDMSDDERSNYSGELDDERANHGDDGKRYISIAELNLSLPHFGTDGGWAMTSESIINIDIVYEKKDKLFSLYAGESDFYWGLDKAFMYGEKEKSCEHTAYWLQSRFDNWLTEADSYIAGIRNGVAAMPKMGHFNNWNGLSITDDRTNAISGKTPIDSKRILTGDAWRAIPVKLDGYKYYKDGVSYPKYIKLIVSFFDPKKNKPEEGKDDFRYGYFDSSDSKLPIISIGIPCQPQEIKDLNESNLNDKLANYLNTLGHELTHFAQFIISLNAGKKVQTGKAKDHQYDGDGVLTEELKQRTNTETGNMEWSLFLPRLNKTHFFGQRKPSEEYMSFLLYNNEIGNRPHGYDDDGSAYLSGLRREHEYRDVEQKSRLHDEINTFKQQMIGVDPSQASAAFKLYVGFYDDAPSGRENSESISSSIGHKYFPKSEWLDELKFNEREKWKQVVLAMYQELSKDPGVDLG